MIYIILGGLLVLTVLMCYQESNKRKISFPAALLICIITTPLLGYFIISSKPLKSAKGCTWCGNKRKETEYCGICNKNESGELRKI